MSPDPLISNLQQDLLLNILEHSEDIGKCAAHITTQIREIIGVRVVALFERVPDGRHRLIGACPDRKKDLFEKENLGSLVDLAGHVDKPLLIHPGEGDIGRLLAALNMQVSFVVPLRVGKESFGFLLLLDIMDEGGIKDILKTLEEISGPLSLILKNSFLFRNLETLVEQRTEALRESEARSRSILQAALDGFWIVDQEGQILDVNDAYCRMAGYSRRELMQMTVQQLEAVETEKKMEERARGIIDGDHARFETAHRRKDGSLLLIDVAARRFPGDDDLIFAFIRDITEQKRAEKEREKLQEQLSQAQKMESVGRLAGGVAHDFNNMLGVILGHTELAMEQVDPSQPIESDLEEIRKAAQRSADLTRQLLAFARKQTIAPKILDLNDTVTGMLKMLQRLIGEGIHLSWQPAADIWPVKMDPSQVDQILANLCINARDAISGSGRIGIETKNVSLGDACHPDHPDFNPGDYVLLAVCDDGGGIEPDILANIFEPFFTTKPLGQGTGLGLATVYGIVRQNRGFITVDSGADKGTTFSIHLPRYTGMGTGISTPLNSDKEDRGHETVLLVEDEPAILKMVEMMLERLGYNVIPASSPAEAIRLSGEVKEKIHVLMTDVIMPEMSGRELAERLMAENPDLKRLFMSGYTADLIVRHGVLDEGVQFLQKPFSKKELAEKIRHVLKP